MEWIRAQLAQHSAVSSMYVITYGHVQYVCTAGDVCAAHPEAQNFRGALRARNFWGLCEQGRNFWMGVRTDRPEFMLYHGLVYILV